MFPVFTRLRRCRSSFRRWMRAFARWRKSASPLRPLTSLYPLFRSIRGSSTSYPRRRTRRIPRRRKRQRGLTTQAGGRSACRTTGLLRWTSMRPVRRRMRAGISMAATLGIARPSAWTSSPADATSCALTACTWNRPCTSTGSRYTRIITATTRSRWMRRNRWSAA